MVRLVDVANQKEQKEGNAKLCRILSTIISEEIKNTDLKVFNYYPNEVPFFAFYRNFIEKILLGTDSEPLTIDGRAVHPRIRVRENKYLDFADRVASRYEKETGTEMTVEYAS